MKREVYKKCQQNYENIYCFSSFFSASISTVKAVETPPTNESMCTIPRESGDEIFISMIDNQYNISRHDENVFIQYNGDGTTSISIVNSDQSATILTSQTVGENENAQSGKRRGMKKVIYKILVWLYNAYSIGGDIKTGCKIIKGVSGIDACGYVSKEVIKSLVKSGIRKKFNVVRYVEKLTCPYPPNSQQCNAPPYAYWRTEIEAT
ncbi:hypothetical protein [Sharpea azabuensis]|uniref:hypothetical protein n=1 Tax=Sharpea azabuensis TaxID=322505 RepID=UPI00156C01B3|nr:hypothetical protein [Sharpea azabuensis]